LTKGAGGIHGCFSDLSLLLPDGEASLHFYQGYPASLIFEKFRIEFSFAFGTDPVAEFSFRVIRDISFNLISISFVITDLLAVCTYGQDFSQGFDFIQCPLKFLIW